MKPVRVGVIGIGNMGWHHARVLSLLRDAELVGVADPDPERGRLAVEQFGCRWFPSYEEMLSEVEAVCIAVPTLLHHRVGMACFQAGVDVLIEKPIAASQEEAAELIQAAEAAGRLLQVGHIERFNPAFRELVKVVANEEVVVLEARRHSPNPDRANDVSVVLDLMIHDIDLVLYLNGPARSVAAHGFAHGEMTDFASALITHENGRFSRIQASRITEKKMRLIEATCVDMFVDCELLRKEIIISRQSEIRQAEGQPYTISAVQEALEVRPQEALLSELQAFVASCRGQHPADLPGVQDGLAAMRISDEIQKAVAA